MSYKSFVFLKRFGVPGPSIKKRPVDFLGDPRAHGVRKPRTSTANTASFALVKLQSRILDLPGLLIRQSTSFLHHSPLVTGFRHSSTLAADDPDASSTSGDAVETDDELLTVKC